MLIFVQSFNTGAHVYFSLYVHSLCVLGKTTRQIKTADSCHDLLLNEILPGFLGQLGGGRAREIGYKNTLLNIGHENKSDYENKLEFPQTDCL